MPAPTDNNDGDFSGNALIAILAFSLALAFAAWRLGFIERGKQGPIDPDGIHITANWGTPE